HQTVLRGGVAIDRGIAAGDVDLLLELVLRHPAGGLAAEGIIKPGEILVHRDRQDLDGRRVGDRRRLPGRNRRWRKGGHASAQSGAQGGAATQPADARSGDRSGHAPSHDVVSSGDVGRLRRPAWASPRRLTLSRPSQVVNGSRLTSGRN
ncbi:MAG: hypothetical protein ACRERD_31755, partial [Candidatus Binatia bacterium]